MNPVLSVYVKPSFLFFWLYPEPQAEEMKAFPTRAVWTWTEGFSTKPGQGWLHVKPKQVSSLLVLLFQHRPWTYWVEGTPASMTTSSLEAHPATMMPFAQEWGNSVVFTYLLSLLWCTEVGVKLGLIISLLLSARGPGCCLRSLAEGLNSDKSSLSAIGS